jgi:methyl-accepting chemotaxis protein
MTQARKFWMFCVLGMAAVIFLVGWGISSHLLSGYTQVVSDRLVLLNELRKGAVEQYFSTAEAELRFWSTNPDILEAQTRMNGLWQQSADKPGALKRLREVYIDQNPNPQGEYRELDDAGDGSHYSAIHASLHPMSKLFVTERGYYDVFLIGSDGDVFYSVEKEADYGTNIVTGEWRDSGLGDVFSAALRQPTQVVMSDMEAYQPSSGAPAIFMAKALTGVGGELLGVIAFQLPTAHILGIMNYTSGMGETGETYLVGQDHLMRSDSRFTNETAVLVQRVDTSNVELALQGRAGVSYTVDYRGVEVLSAFSNLNVGDTSWAVMAEIDREEVESGAASERPNLMGILSFFYALTLWSAWYWRGRELGGADVDYGAQAMQFEGGDFSEGVG